MIRTRYSETDRMGYVYYGNYAQYYEISRVELLRELGISYLKLEDIGILMPVIAMQVDFLKPAYYDQEISILCTVNEMPTSRMKFDYQIRNEQGILINEGTTTLVFINSSSGKPMRCPKILIELLQPYFS